MYVYLCVCKFLYMFVYIYIFIYLYIHTYVYVHTYSSNTNKEITHARTHVHTIRPFALAYLTEYYLVRRSWSCSLYDFLQSAESSTSQAPVSSSALCSRTSSTYMLLITSRYISNTTTLFFRNDYKIRSKRQSWKHHYRNF